MTHNCRTPKPKTSQDGESAGVGKWACSELRGGRSARLLRGGGTKLVVMATGRRLWRKSLMRRLRVFLRPRCKRHRLLPRLPRTHLSRWTLRSSRRRPGRGHRARQYHLQARGCWRPCFGRFRGGPEGGEGDAAKSLAGIQADVTTAQAGLGCTGQGCAQASLGWVREVALRLLLEVKNQARMVAASAVEVA